MLSLQWCLTLCDPMDCSLPGSSVHGVFHGKNTVVVCHFLLQGIFPTQGLNPHLLRLLNWQVGSLPLEPLFISYTISKYFLSFSRLSVCFVCGFLCYSKAFVSLKKKKKSLEASSSVWWIEHMNLSSFPFEIINMEFQRK